MKTKKNLITLAAVVASIVLSCGLLSAQNNAKYYDPAQFYTLDAAYRSDDGLARVVYIPTEDDIRRPLLQILTADGKIVSSDGFSRFERMCEAKVLRSFKTQDGSTVYLYVQSKPYFEDEGTVYTDWVSAFRIGKNGKMEQVPFFKTANLTLKEIACEWKNYDSIEACDHWLYANLDSDDYDYYVDYLGITYHAKTSSLYIPLIEKNNSGSYSKKYTNRFLVYKFDGNAFVFKGREAPYWLHSSLKEYQSTEIYFMTDEYLVQIDKLKDGSYRYASWKNGNSLQDMGRKPSLVIGGGSYKNNRFTFKNSTYTYIIDKDDMTLVVKNNGKTILEQYIYD